MNIANQKGFTLIELLIAMLIGLIIVAAVTQIYVTGVRNAAVQKAASGVLDANVFGLQQIEKSLRMTGLGLGKTSSMNKTCSGVIISSGAERFNCDGTQVENNPPDKVNADMYSVKLEGLRPGITALAVDMRTKADGGPVNTSNNKASQLTIQYRAPVDMRDCEGRLALGPREVNGYVDGRQLADNTNTRVDGQVIIERYFTKKNDEGELELRCDAGRYVLEHIELEPNPAHAEAKIIGVNSPLQNIGDDGSLIIAGIDDFQVQFGVIMPTGGLQYLNINEYQTGNIVAIKLGILAKGNNKIPQIDASDNTRYTLLGKEITLASDQPTNLIRRTYETTTMLRNSREGK